MTASDTLAQKARAFTAAEANYQHAVANPARLFEAVGASLNAGRAEAAFRAQLAQEWHAVAELLAGPPLRMVFVQPAPQPSPGAMDLWMIGGKPPAFTVAEVASLEEQHLLAVAGRLVMELERAQPDALSALPPSGVRHALSSLVAAWRIRETGRANAV